ncbi:sodium:solute symporter family protein [Vibrio splendidus]|uniref:sodium:solute symporter family protein n=1 Tax=Vibrio splendidus TaxID=29497 RepID=UPI000D390BE2|nr:sodium:solute symporter family protein [Vibrio splendidus]PTO58509.1 sodium:proline symporter [Vibrio splendidus]PTP06874.1 sodium:proline symporter [Vibrio splendidus]PTQ06908.1 sodium:proline symporter [Vibrio splendidus]
MNSTLFLTGFGVYVLFLIWLGWFVSRNQKSGEDFLLGGRGLPMFLVLGTTVATMVGTGSSMGAVGFGYANGWAGALYGIGGAIGILLLALWFAPVRKLNFMTMSEELAYYVGANRIVKNVVGVLIFVASIGWLGAHILGGGMYLAWIADIDLNLAKIIIAAAFTIYVVIGGYTAVVWTDTIQAVILFAGFILMAVMSVDYIGGMDNLYAAMDPAATSFLAIDKLGLLPAVSLAVVIGVGVLATPSFRQRIYSGKDVSTVRRSFVASGVLYLFFSIIPAIIGMAAHAIDPSLDNANYSFPYVAATVLPVGVGMIVLIAGLSATMSSASSDAIAGVSILLRDVYVMFTGRVPNKESMVNYSRLALIVVIGFALLFALTSNDIIGYITKMISTVMSGMFVCGMLGRFWKRYNWQGALATLAGASVASFVVMLNADYTAFWGNPVIPSCLVALTAGVLVSLCTPANLVTPEMAKAILDDERALMEMELSDSGVLEEDGSSQRPANQTS